MYNHPCPIGLGDSDFYISKINYFKTYTPFTSLKYQGDAKSKFIDDKDCLSYFNLFYSVPYHFILGRIAAFFNLSSKDVFHFNFYVGIFFIGIVLFLIFKNHGQTPYNYLVGFILFAFYTGNGSYHGFFWITPSFYCILFWLFLFWSFFYSKHWYILSPIFLLFLFFSHPMSLFGIASILGTIVLCGLFEKSIGSEIKKALFLCAVALFFYITYKLLLKSNYIIPIFAESLGMENKWTFDFRGLKLLLSHSPFYLYFSGIFLPLTINGIYYCIKKKEYKIFSLFLITFIGTTFLSSMHLRGERTFLFLEISLLFVIAYGIQHNIQTLIILYNQNKNVSFKNKKVIIFTANSLIVLLSVILILFHFKTRISFDFIHKFQNTRIFQSEKMESYIQKNFSNNPVLFLGSDYGLLSVLSFDGWWDKSFILPCMFTNNDADLPDDCIVIGNNYKQYDDRRKGIGIFFPKKSELNLNTGQLEPGQYILSIKDSNLVKVDYNIQILSKSNNKKNASNVWKKKNYDVKILTEHLFPWFTLPWHQYLSHLSFVKEKFKFPVIRNSYDFSTPLLLSEQVTSIVIQNKANESLLMGIISLIKLPDKKIVFEVDIDKATKKDINQNIQFIKDNVRLPLLWYDPEYPIQNNKQESKKYLFVMEENFGDIKLFKLFKVKQ